MTSVPSAETSPVEDRTGRLSYARSTYHRRAVYDLARQHQHRVRGRALHVGGRNSFWLLQPAAQKIGLELDRSNDIDVMGDGLALPFQDNSFDAVISLEVLEHVPQPQQMIDEMYRVVKPGGYVLLSTPFVWKVHRLPKDYWRFTKDSLEMLFREFAAVDVLPVNGARETFMHVTHQYVEVLLDTLKITPKAIVFLKIVEFFAYLVMPKERTRDPLWTTGWFVVARK